MAKAVRAFLFPASQVRNLCRIIVIKVTSSVGTTSKYVAPDGAEICCGRWFYKDFSPDGAWLLPPVDIPRVKGKFERNASVLDCGGTPLLLFVAERRRKLAGDNVPGDVAPRASVPAGTADTPAFPSSFQDGFGLGFCPARCAGLISVATARQLFSGIHSYGFYCARFLPHLALQLASPCFPPAALFVRLAAKYNKFDSPAGRK